METWVYAFGASFVNMGAKTPDSVAGGSTADNLRRLRYIICGPYNEKRVAERQFDPGC